MPERDALILHDGSPRVLFCGSATLDKIFLVGVLPDGADGCLWKRRGCALQLTGHQVRGVDTLAAGHVFHGTLTWALAQWVAMADAIKLANAAAAIKCQTFGGRLGAPDRAALRAFLEERT